MALLSAQNKAQDQLSFDRCIGAIKISEPFSSFCHPWMNHFSRVPPLLLEFTLQYQKRSHAVITFRVAFSGA